MQRQAAVTLNVVFVDPGQIREINQAYLGHDRETDVIAFDLAPDLELEMLADAEPPVLGEVYVCPEVASRAAGEQGTTFAEELVLYVVHGMLHIAGEDDLNEKARNKRRAAEARVMQQLKDAFALDALLHWNTATTESES